MSDRYWFPPGYGRMVARLRVPSGFLLVLAFAWLARPTLQSLAWSLPVSVAGLALRAWAAGHLAKNQQLATGGPYAHVRNPLYVGTLLVAAGLVAASRRAELAVLFAAVFFFIYLPVIEQEEQHLRKLFPEYSSYARQVPMLFPRLTTIIPESRFRPDLYLRNQEYQALLGYGAGLAFLIWKASA